MRLPRSVKPVAFAGFHPVSLNNSSHAAYFIQDPLTRPTPPGRYDRQAGATSSLAGFSVRFAAWGFPFSRKLTMVSSPK